MTVEQVLQAAQLHDAGRLLFPVRILFGQHLEKVFAHRFLHEQRLRILRQHAHRAFRMHLAAVRLRQAVEKFQRSRLAAAVAAQHRVELALPHFQGKTLYHVGKILFVAVIQFLRTKHDRRFSGCCRAFRIRLFPRFQRMILRVRFQPVLAFAHRERYVRVLFPVRRRSPDAHGGGHGQEHRAAPVTQRKSRIPRRAAEHHFALVHDDRAVRQGERLFEPVLGQEHRRAELAVDLAQGRQKIRRRDGVELARRFVQDQHRRAHHHDGREVQQLLLAAGQFGHVLVEPVLDAEERGHLGHPSADLGRLDAKALQPEGQFVPDLVRHHLVVRVLLHEADAFALRAQVHVRQGYAVDQDLSRQDALRRHDALQLAQHRRLAAAGRSAKHGKIALLHRKARVLYGRDILLRICERQIPDDNRFHIRSSLRSRNTGVKQRAK